MKRNILLLFLIFCSIATVAQINDEDKLSVDLDKDGIKDHVVFDKDNGVIIVKLSTQKFKPIQSKPVEFEFMSSGIRTTKSGFEFSNNYMRAGYSCQFRYNPKQKKIQLIGMSRYEFGPASNDGSGKSSVNLLTNNYIGNWNFWDDEKEELIPMKTIKLKMTFPVTYLSGFDDGIFNKFQDKCVSLYEKAHEKMKKSQLLENQK
ncbi:hypothetical protein EZJ43_13260 [Pedobacter changchengzhani]|uniref:DUF4468 domain-containing protein n=1 Tax=Pedobacter changchengzhani TaxID=2529274 RepID=A0A4R5MJ01_9SPHI|nr:hypothetical protein [Pedobacter changchengzhani]TDG35584.1 hypothetical protein EZJ43_13260 [Pedobacter changchengzhani]